MSTPKNVVFDIVGTLVSYEHLFEAFNERLSERLRASSIQPKLLRRYVVFFKVFEALFYRCLHYAGIKDPHSFASEDDVAYLVQEWKKLVLREGAAECISKLREAGFTVWCFTAGDIAPVRGYFSRGGVEMPVESLLSCDSAGLAKPTLEAYEPILKRLSADGSKPWFAAAHLWDASTAKTVVFSAAYCTTLEGEALPDIFGQMDIVTDTLPDMADKIITASSS
ncbi:haloacid dehalogenase-like hydrolase [Dactylonectria macrodidyma]|uniref:Haloacid dehalogenase-like hydrolase n=1 Tax=Dactylonectria macrodidyma TaxID=307937 RepID=A0A9P9EQ65_9HYPO|nr:haloacid dehalogenase-like hydrolase [Dactylonectria macrodidyma]